MTTSYSSLTTLLAARRSLAQQQDSDPVGSRPVPADPPSEPTTRAPFVPEWRRRAAERVQRSGYVAVLDTTSLA